MNPHKQRQLDELARLYAALNSRNFKCVVDVCLFININTERLRTLIRTFKDEPIKEKIKASHDRFMQERDTSFNQFSEVDTHRHLTLTPAELSCLSLGQKTLKTAI